MQVNDSPDSTSESQAIYLDRTEKDNSKWLELIINALQTAKRFEIHCWNEETNWIEFALQYGTLKKSTWKYGKIIEGDNRKIKVSIWKGDYVCEKRFQRYLAHLLFWQF